MDLKKRKRSPSLARPQRHFFFLLPNDLLFLFFAFLDIYDLLQFRQVSKYPFTVIFSLNQIKKVKCRYTKFPIAGVANQDFVLAFKWFGSTKNFLGIERSEDMLVLDPEEKKVVLHARQIDLCFLDSYEDTSFYFTATDLPANHHNIFKYDVVTKKKSYWKTDFFEETSRLSYYWYDYAMSVRDNQCFILWFGEENFTVQKYILMEVHSRRILYEKLLPWKRTVSQLFIDKHEDIFYHLSSNYLFIYNLFDCTLRNFVMLRKKKREFSIPVPNVVFLLMISSKMYGIIALMMKIKRKKSLQKSFFIDWIELLLHFNFFFVFFLFLLLIPRKLKPFNFGKTNYISY